MIKMKNKEVENMVVISDKNIISPEIIEESFDCAEINDCGRFFIPAEICISEEKIGW